MVWWHSFLCVCVCVFPLVTYCRDAFVCGKRVRLVNRTHTHGSKRIKICWDVQSLKKHVTGAFFRLPWNRLSWTHALHLLKRVLCWRCFVSLASFQHTQGHETSVPTNRLLLSRGFLPGLVHSVWSWHHWPFWCCLLEIRKQIFEESINRQSAEKRR